MGTKISIFKNIDFFILLTLCYWSIWFVQALLFLSILYYPTPLHYYSIVLLVAINCTYEEAQSVNFLSFQKPGSISLLFPNFSEKKMRNEHILVRFLSEEWLDKQKSSSWGLKRAFLDQTHTSYRKHCVVGIEGVNRKSDRKIPIWMRKSF